MRTPKLFEVLFQCSSTGSARRVKVGSSQEDQENLEEPARPAAILFYICDVWALLTVSDASSNVFTMDDFKVAHGASTIAVRHGPNTRIGKVIKIAALDRYVMQQGSWLLLRTGENSVFTLLQDVDPVQQAMALAEGHAVQMTSETVAAVGMAKLNEQWAFHHLGLEPTGPKYLTSEVFAPQSHAFVCFWQQTYEILGIRTLWNDFNVDMLKSPCSACSDTYPLQAEAG